MLFLMLLGRTANSVASIFGNLGFQSGGAVYIAYVTWEVERSFAAFGGSHTP